MLNRKSFSVIFTVSMFLGLFSSAAAQWEWEWDPIMKLELSRQEVEWNNQIRREKFDLVLPVVINIQRHFQWQSPVNRVHQFCQQLPNSCQT